VDADVRQVINRPKWNQQLKNAWIDALAINGVGLQQWRAADRDRYRMLAGIARLQMRGVIVLVVVRRGPMMLVCGEPVMVLGMVVIAVRVSVQRRELAGGRGQDQSERDRYETMHKPECME
jgi:hypothetical protein